MNILVVNDDGINSPGIKILTKSLKPYGDIYVVAPHSEQSGIGHGITIKDPMKLHEHNDFMENVKAWSLEGKPADCVKFALFGLKLQIDLVVSGINNGPNLGTDIMYSGTIAGALEAIICGIPALAFSADFNNLDTAERDMPRVLNMLIKKNLMNTDIVYNVNFPSKAYDDVKGIKITKQGIRPFLHEFELEDGAYWPRGTWDVAHNGANTDVYAFENGYISITPIKLDRTDYEYVEKLKKELEI